MIFTGQHVGSINYQISVSRHTATYHFSSVSITKFYTLWIRVYKTTTTNHIIGKTFSSTSTFKHIGGHCHVTKTSGMKIKI